MIFSLDNMLGIHPAALEFRSQRGQLLAQNLANADTPNYKAQDIDFKAALEQARSAGTRLRRTHQRHLAGSTPLPNAVQYRVPLHPSLDGNTVTTHLEQAEFAQNAMRYQASILFLNRRLSGIRAALSDQ